MITANVICDSVSPQSHRLTTFELRYPKFIHGEFMTHRVFSRNASSSRAIPTAKLIAEVRDDATRAGPVFWGRNQKGMQAVEEFTADDLRYVQDLWRDAAIRAADAADHMALCGVHKQIVNRILEPFSHINVVVTATEYMNFFGLRLDKGAQPEARALAQAMWEAYLDSAPKRLDPGEWHLPYMDEWYEDGHDCNLNFEQARKVSVARCARVSYRSFETGKRSKIDEDLALYDRLLSAQPLHASPAEHQATPDFCDPEGCNMRWQYPNEHGNFTGWRQYRKMLSGEACAPLPAGYHL